MSSQETPVLRSEVARDLSLDQIRYSAVWEDERLLKEGLDISPDDDVLSISSAGANVLAILLEEPRSVTAIDMNPAQNHLVELKLVGIEWLEYEAFIALVVHGGDEALEIYAGLREHLSEEARRFWDGHEAELKQGVSLCGRLDRYFDVFRKEHLAALWPEDLIERLFNAPDLETQARIFESEGFGEDLHERFRWYFGREKMAEQGRDPSQFRYVEKGGVGDYFLGRFHDVCTRLPMKGNFYIERFLTGGCRDLDQGPVYLRRENFKKLKGLVDRVTLVTEELETHLTAVAPGTYSKANLSDVFEYMSEEASDSLFGLFARALRPGGRIAYWNLLVERKPPARLSDKLVYRAEQSQTLWLEDRAWFYGSFRLEDVRP